MEVPDASGDVDPKKIIFCQIKKRNNHFWNGLNETTTNHKTMQGAFNSPTIQECFELFVCSAPSQVPDPDHWARLVVALVIQGLKSPMLFAHRTWRYAVSDSSLGPSYRAKCSRPKKSELDPGHGRTNKNISVTCR